VSAAILASLPRENPAEIETGATIALGRSGHSEARGIPPELLDGSCAHLGAFPGMLVAGVRRSASRRFPKLPMGRGPVAYSRAGVPRVPAAQETLKRRRQRPSATPGKEGGQGDAAPTGSCGPARS
jgi:hypothetical protein